jgi:hypothetical protein
VISPPPAILVDQTFTFIINCTAMGVPTPEVVWRLNWGHVPDKCRMTNTVQEGNRAFGELTCPNAVLSDSGIRDPLFACVQDEINTFDKDCQIFTSTTSLSFDFRDGHAGISLMPINTLSL